MYSKRIYLYIKDNKCKFTETLPNLSKNRTRLVFISDTHEKHKEIYNIPTADIFIHLGDILYNGNKYIDSVALSKYKRFNKWIGKIDCKYKIIIGGNHDHYLEKIGSEKSKEIFTNCNYLYNEFLICKNIVFFASPFNIGRSKNNAFQNKLIYKDLYEKTLNTKIDFLITHGPIDNDFFINRQISNHVWGHMHNKYGVHNIKFTDKIIKSICACSLNNNYKLFNGPIIMDF